MGWLACRNRKSTSPKVGEARKESNLLRIPRSWAHGPQGTHKAYSSMLLFRMVPFEGLVVIFNESTRICGREILFYDDIHVTVFPQCFCMSTFEVSLNDHLESKSVRVRSHVSPLVTKHTAVVRTSFLSNRWRTCAPPLAARKLPYGTLDLKYREEANHLELKVFARGVDPSSSLEQAIPKGN